MKKILLLAILCFATCYISAQENDTTTYYLIRHAEKNRSDKTNKNPELTEMGLKRAAHWAKVLENVSFDLVYSTNYHRTIQTAAPTASSNKLKITFYDPSNMYDVKFQEQSKGKNVLVVGHSNTTPQFVNKILGTSEYKDIDDLNNSNLYIITVHEGVENNIHDLVLKIEMTP